MNNGTTAERYYTYDEAPVDSDALRGMGITARQLRRAVQLGKISYVKPGLRVLFSEVQLREWVERSTVRAVR